MTSLPTRVKCTISRIDCPFFLPFFEIIIVIVIVIYEKKHELRKRERCRGLEAVPKGSVFSEPFWSKREERAPPDFTR